MPESLDAKKVRLTRIYVKACVGSFFLFGVVMSIGIYLGNHTIIWAVGFALLSGLLGGAWAYDRLTRAGRDAATSEDRGESTSEPNQRIGDG